MDASLWRRSATRDDGIDNDLDGFVDMGDVSCGNLWSNNEVAHSGGCGLLGIEVLPLRRGPDRAPALAAPRVSIRRHVSLAPHHPVIRSWCREVRPGRLDASLRLQGEGRQKSSFRTPRKSSSYHLFSIGLTENPVGIRGSHYLH